MYAIIATGGKQYKVSEGDIITRQLRCCESRKLIPHCAAYSSILA